MGCFSRIRSVSLILLLAAGSGVFMQAQVTLVEPPIPLLPGQFAEWQRTGEPLIGTDATQVDPANAPLLKEDGLQRFASSTYQHGATRVEATVFQFGDATGAYSAFTFFRSALPGARATGTKLGNDIVSSGDTTLVLAETAVLRTKGSLDGRDLGALAAALPKTGGRRGLQPLLPTYLPPTGLERQTVRYALGPVGYRAMGGVLPADLLGFEKSTEAITAEYSGKGLLTLLLYPTPQIAGDRGRAIEKAINEGAKGALGTVKMRRIGPLIGITTGGLPPAQAQALITSLHMNSEVTFDKKMPLEFHAEVHKTATLLQSIALFSGIVGAAGVLLGIFLGGARAGIRVMMGKTAHVEAEFLTINLRGRSKALEGHESDG